MHRSPVLRQENDAKRAKMDSREQIQEWNAGTPNFNGTNGQGLFSIPTSSSDADARTTDNNVSATPLDLNHGAYYSAGTPYSQNHGSTYGNDILDFSGANNGWNSGGEDMWYLPAGAAFFQNNDQAITQTAEGVNVGGMDLLDYMALDNFTGGDGMGF